MAEKIHDDNLSSKLDTFLNAGCDFARAWFHSWLARQAEARAGAVEVSRRPSTEIAPAPILSDKRELSVKELAARWGVSTRSIYEWKTTGGLKFKKVGRLLRFDTIEADLWARRHQESLAKRRLRLVR